MKIKPRYKRVKNIMLGAAIPIMLYFILRSVQALFSIPERGEGFSFFLSEILILILMAASLRMSLDHSSFDFSLGATAMLAPMLTLCIFDGVGVGTLFFCSLFFGCLLGFICGAVSVFSRLSPACCSLCVCLLYEGIAMLNYKNVAFAEGTFKISLKFFLVLTAIILLIIWLVFKKTVFGHDYTAISKNASVAEGLGVNIPLNRLIYHIISGGVMGCVGVMLMQREGQSIPSGLNFTSIRILFYGILPLFIGRLLSAMVGEGMGFLSGCVCAGIIYSFLDIWGVGDNVTIMICAGVILLLLIYLGNKHSILKKIRRQNIQFNKSQKKFEKNPKRY